MQSYRRFQRVRAFVSYGGWLDAPIRRLVLGTGTGTGTGTDIGTGTGTGWGGWLPRLDGPVPPEARLGQRGLAEFGYRREAAGERWGQVAKEARPRATKEEDEAEHA